MTEGVRVEGPKPADATVSRALGVLLARVALSLLFLMAGIFKVFRMGALSHAERFFLPYREAFSAWGPSGTCSGTRSTRSTPT